MDDGTDDLNNRFDAISEEDVEGEWVRFFDYDAREAEHKAEVERLRDRGAYLESALRIIAEGTICPDLFPADKDENIIAAKTAMVTAIAALAHLDAAQHPTPADMAKEITAQKTNEL